jgi:hypothetical protein
MHAKCISIQHRSDIKGCAGTSPIVLLFGAKSESNSFGILSFVIPLPHIRFCAPIKSSDFG